MNLNRLLAEKWAVDEEIWKILDLDGDDFVEGTLKPVPSMPAVKTTELERMTATI